MNTKLTLSIDEKVIASAKRISKTKGVSLSKLIEDYLREISGSKKEKRKSIVDELAGVLGPVSAETDYKQEIRDYLHEKYLRK